MGKAPRLEGMLIFSSQWKENFRFTFAHRMMFLVVCLSRVPIIVLSFSVRSIFLCLDSEKMQKELGELNQPLFLQICITQKPAFSLLKKSIQIRLFH